MPFGDGISDMATPALLAVFAVATLVIVLAGVRLTGLADRIADSTGMGEAIAGAALLGMVTSLSGVTVSVTAALEGRAALAFSNAVGGIAAQTAFLALADLLHRKANLEHAAAELANVFQAALLAFLLSLPVLAHAGPEMSVLGAHPASLVLLAGYCLGLRMAAKVRDAPMWHAVDTSATRIDDPDEAAVQRDSLPRMLLRFFALGLLLALAGYAIARSGGALAARLGVSDTLVGAMMTAVATSLPELVTTLAAVRRGALQLAVGGVIGGNSFDVLFLTASDMAYREGSIYHAIGRADIFWSTVALAMTAVLILGLIVRERRGVGGIGFESALILALYVTALAVQSWAQ